MERGTNEPRPGPGLKQKLIAIQNELHAPKDKHNSFGNYNYRSCESILEALKPLMAKYGCLLLLGDEVAQIGERYYIKATAYIEDQDSGEHYRVSAYAREADDKKGLDAAQVSGAASSYARKYCLSAAFLLDDNKDPDTNEFVRENAIQKDDSSRQNRKAPAAWCEVCGKAVPADIAKRSRAANGGRVYCSGTCRDAANKSEE